MRARLMIAGAVALLAVSSGAAAAQGNPDAPGQQRKAEREAQGRRDADAQRQGEPQRRSEVERQARFRDEDREHARNWYNQHRDRPPKGLRERDRMTPDREGELRPGYTFDRDMQRRSYPAPLELTRGFAPAPRGYRYVVIGGHIVLVDDRYRVADVFRLD